VLMVQLLPKFIDGRACWRGYDKGLAGPTTPRCCYTEWGDPKMPQLDGAAGELSPYEALRPHLPDFGADSWTGRREWRLC
jgi:hypothetical protein